MPITSEGLKQAILSEMNALDENSEPDAAVEALSNAIVGYILDNLNITVPAASVITSVTGGSGSPAIGTPNVAPISCEVK